MLTAFFAGWILGSISLYAYLVLTAKEPENQECMDCELAGCEDCPLGSKAEQTPEVLAA